MPKKQLPEITGKPINETKQEIENKIGTYNRYLNQLLYYPWHLTNPEIFENVYNFFVERLNGKTGEKLIKIIRLNIIKSLRIQQSIPEYYPFVFVKNHGKIIINGLEYQLLFTIGKRKNGKYDLFHIQYVTKKTYDNLFIHLQNIGIKKIDTIIIHQNRITQTGFNNISDILPKYFP